MKEPCSSGDSGKLMSIKKVLRKKHLLNIKRFEKDYSLYFLKMMAALCPPNPKVLESTALMSRF